MTSKLKKIGRFIKDSDYRFSILSSKYFYNFLDDEVYIKRRFKSLVGYEPNLYNPQTLCEKLNWLKLYDRKEEYTNMVDKFKVKKYVADRIGEEHVIPCYGVWDSFEDIDFGLLPNQFVLKVTHDSGGFVICKDKSSFDYSQAKKKISKSLKTNYYMLNREWPYKNIKRKIIAEKYIQSLGHSDSVEYKLTCMNGEVKFITICTGVAHSEASQRKNDHFDRHYNRLPWEVVYKKSAQKVSFPPQMDKMIEYAELLSNNIPYVRIDFYIIDEQIYFGEMTFYTWGGYMKFVPEKWDTILGSWLILPQIQDRG